jgi:hypothetical protein
MVANKGTYHIRTACGSVPTYAEQSDGLTMDAVKAMLTSIDPGHVADVGQAYIGASDALTTAADQLHQHAQRITETWSGESADGALNQLGQLNKTAAELQEKSATTGNVLSWLGSEILPWYKNEGQKLGHGFISDGGDDKAARDLLDRMDNRIMQGYNGVPESISKDLPPPSHDLFSQGTDKGGSGTPGSGPPSGPPYGSSPGGPPGTYVSPGPIDATPIGPGGGTTGPSGPGAGPPGDGGTGLPGGGLPGGGVGLPGTGGTDIAGLGGGGMGADPFGAGGLGGGAGGLGAGAGGLGGGAGGLGAGTGGLGGGVLGLGTPGVIGSGRGGSPGSAGDSAARGTAGKSGLNSPMAAGEGQGGEEEKERERTTWLAEDEDVWSDDDDIAPPVIE